MKHCWLYDTPFGRIGLAEENGKLQNLYLDGEPEEGCVMGETPLLADAARQLREYFAGERREFDLPLDPAGTPFRRAVWDALLAIPYGETRSYKELAGRIGNPGAVRAVGQANRHNPLPIFIPCHRVIGADGGLTGYAGRKSVGMKRRLLELEGALPAV